MESILDYVQRRLKESGSHRWEAIARAAGCSTATPRKVVYERTNPGVNTVEPLFRYFQLVDSGAATLPGDAMPSGGDAAEGEHSCAAPFHRRDGTVVEEDQRTYDPIRARETVFNKQRSTDRPQG